MKLFLNCIKFLYEVIAFMLVLSLMALVPAALVLFVIVSIISRSLQDGIGIGIGVLLIGFSLQFYIVPIAITHKKVIKGRMSDVIILAVVGLLAGWVSQRFFIYVFNSQFSILILIIGTVVAAVTGIPVDDFDPRKSDEYPGLIDIIEGGELLYRKDFFSLGWFLKMASKGSHKSVEGLGKAERATILKLSNNSKVEKDDLEKFIAPLESVFLSMDFDNKPNNVLELIISKKWLKNDNSISASPLHERSYYQSLRKAGKKVPEWDLLHDSIIELSNSWSINVYRNRLVQLRDDRKNFNSLDVTVCMLVIAIAYPSEDAIEQYV